jgi:hypothetical protein
MSGIIIQKTSVKKYNDHFNEVLNLTNEMGANAAIVWQYINRLKSDIHTTTITPLQQMPNLTFDQ